MTMKYAAEMCLSSFVKVEYKKNLIQCEVEPKIWHHGEF